MLSLQCYVIVEYPINVIPLMLCYCRISYKRHPFNVMLLSNILQKLSLQCYVIVEYPTNVIPPMLCYCRISHKRYPFNVMLLSNIL